MLHRLVALPLAGLAALAFASVALAGGWAQVTASDIPTDPPAGGGTPIELKVLQHGVTPVSWPSLTVIATDARSGNVVRTDAKAKGPTGTYVATINFPTSGAWTLTFESRELEMAGSAAVHVAQPVAAQPVAPAAPVAAPPAPVAQPVDAASVTTGLDLMPLALLLVAVGVAFAAAGLLGRSAAAAARDTRVPVKN